MPREIITNWVTEAGSGFVSVMYFQEGAETDAARLAVNDFWTDVSLYLTTGTQWTVNYESRLLDNETGALMGLDTDTTNYMGAGGYGGEAVADSTQGLIRWQTGVVVGRRFLQGRTFVPGIAGTAVINGNLSSSAQVGLSSAGNDFIAAAPTFGVWHRPVASSGGAFWPASSAQAWFEFAVLRRRRK